MPSLYCWDKIDLEIEGIGVNNLPRTCDKYKLHLGVASYSLRIKIDGSEKGPWSLELDSKDRRFQCAISKTYMVTIEIVCEHKHKRLHPSHVIATLEERADKMFRCNADRVLMEIPIPYIVGNGAIKHIMLSYKISHIMTANKLNPGTNKTALKCRALYTINDLKSMAVVAQLLEKGVELDCPQWINLLGSLGRFGQIVQELCDLDPKAKAALVAVTAAFELFIAQKERDERVANLAEIMSHLYQMILDSEPLQKCKTLENAIESLIDLTRECAYFISDYISHGSFTQRLLTSATNFSSPIDDCISQYEKSFMQLKEHFIIGIALDAALNSVRIWEKLAVIDAKIDDVQLDLYKSRIASNFPIVYGKQWENQVAFIPRYRISVLLNDICAWGGVVNSKNCALLLSNIPKCGKTNVARLVAGHFHEQRRLASAIFVDSGFGELTKDVLISSLIRDLANYDNRLLKEIASSIDKYPRILNDYPGSKEDRLQRLILEPLYRTPFTGAILVIIDGIPNPVCDESFIELLLRLPPAIRLFLTTSDDGATQKFTKKYCSRVNIIEMISGDSTLCWDANSYIHGYLKIFETHQPTLFSEHSLESTKAGISNACKGMYSLAFMICKLIAFLPIDGASYFIGALGSRVPPETNVEECLKTLLSSPHCVTAIRILLGIWPSSYSEATNELLIQGFLCTNDSSMQQEFINMLQLNLIRSSSSGQVSDSLAIHIPSACWDTALVFEASEYKSDVAIRDKMLSNDLLCPHCSKAPQWLKILFKVATSHHPIHYDHKELQDGVISTDQRIWSSNLYKHSFFITGPSKSFHVAAITEPLKFSTTAGRFTAVRFTLEDYLITSDFPGTYWYEAAIYRCASDEGQKHLSKIQQSVSVNTLGVKGVTKDSITNISSVHEAQHPLTGQGKWELQKSTNIPTYKEYNILWHREPIDCIEDRSDDSPDEHGEGQGVGFVNSLQSGDRIAVIACTHLADERRVYRCCRVSVDVLYAEYPEEDLNLRRTVYRHLSVSSTNRCRVSGW